MDTHKAHAETFDTGDGPVTVVPVGDGFAEAGYAVAYAKDLFARLSGHAAARRRDAEGDRKPGAAADHALAYAKDLFERLRVHPGDDRPDHGRHGVAFDRGVRTDVDPSIAYARYLFTRLTGFPGRAGASAANSFAAANAIGRAVKRLARLICGAVVEPFARKRRRRIAIAQLEALDDRLLADIGLARGDIVGTVDGMLTRRSTIVSRPVKHPPLAEERADELRLAA